MKHTKKWLKITASTLALTGAIATPIALTSCSNTENGPVDPVSSYELNANFNNTIYPSTYFDNMYTIDITSSEIHQFNNYIYISLFKDGNSVIDNRTNFECQINIQEPTTSDVEKLEDYDRSFGNNNFLGAITFRENVKTIKFTYKLTNKMDPNFFGEGINYQEVNCTINIKA